MLTHNNLGRQTSQLHYFDRITNLDADLQIIEYFEKITITANLIEGASLLHYPALRRLIFPLGLFIYLPQAWNVPC